MLAKISAGVSEEEFILAIANSVQTPSASETPQPIHPSSSSSTPPSSTPPSSLPTATTDRNAVYEERKARLEKKRAAEEKAEHERRLARRSSSTPDPPGRSSNTTYLEQQRRRQLAAQEERQRVLRLLENDKAERREREAKRKQALEETTAPSSSKENVPTRPAGKETAISFRLLDGSSLKAKFPSESILGTDVRTWLDQNRNDGDHPYSLLQILAPLPNKSLSTSDENSSLVELGLSPTATLVLVPVQTYTTAYRGGGTSNEVGLLSKAYSMVYGAVTTVLGVGYSAAPPPAAVTTPVDPAPAAPAPPRASSRAPSRAPVQSRPGTAGGLPMSRTNSANGRIRTLYDQRDEDGRAEPERKYYNGNQVCALQSEVGMKMLIINSWTLSRSRKMKKVKGRSN